MDFLHGDSALVAISGYCDLYNDRETGREGCFRAADHDPPHAGYIEQPPAPCCGSITDMHMPFCRETGSTFASYPVEVTWHGDEPPPPYVPVGRYLP